MVNLTGISSGFVKFVNLIKPDEFTVLLFFEKLVNLTMDNK